jgi:hypothetical protein
MHEVEGTPSWILEATASNTVDGVQTIRTYETM